MERSYLLVTDRIPLGDNLLEITASLPENELTAVLRDFRQYRPPTQREYINSIEARARLSRVKVFAHGDLKSLALYVLNVDQVRNSIHSVSYEMFAHPRAFRFENLGTVIGPLLKSILSDVRHTASRLVII